jgi:hypothetical protein
MTIRPEKENASFIKALLSWDLALGGKKGTEDEKSSHLLRRKNGFYQLRVR